MNKTVWIVVANRAVARLFRTSRPMGPLEELDAFIHPEGRLPEHELVSDRAGRGFERMGQGGYAEDSDTSATAHETT
ncbi:MAG: host attachment protein, partial [Dyella sp.]|nr:host attachment protein [Dyella sp.]